MLCSHCLQLSLYGQLLEQLYVASLPTLLSPCSVNSLALTVTLWANLIMRIMHWKPGNLKVITRPRHPVPSTYVI